MSKLNVTLAEHLVKIFIGALMMAFGFGVWITTLQLKLSSAQGRVETLEKWKNEREEARLKRLQDEVDRQRGERAGHR